MSASLPAVPRTGRVAARLRRPARTDLGWLLLAGVVLFGAGLGLRDPWPADEPRFALIARDMVASGQWLIPRIGGEIYSDKPPLFMWLTAALYALTGELRVAFLLPSLLAGLGMLALVHDLASRLWNRRVALAAGLLLLLSVQFTLQARTAQLDALVSLWTTLGLYGLLRHLLLGPDWRWYTVGGLAMGLGIMTKGVGFLPLFVLLPWLWLRWRTPAALPAITGGARWLLAPAAMLLPLACWLVPMLLAVSFSGAPELAAYRDDLLFRQTVTRYADTWTHLRPAWYYLVEVIPWAWLPATLALPWLVPAWRRRLARGDARYWLLLGFVVATVVFFSLSPGKRGVYLLPALPAFALAAAPLLAAGLWQRPALRVACLVVLGLVGAGGLFLAAVLSLDIGGGAEQVDALGLPVEALALLAAGIGVAAAALGGWGLVAHREAVALAALLAVNWLLQGVFAYPVLNEARSGGALMAEVRAAVPWPQPLGVIGWKEQYLLQIDRPVVHFGFRREPGPELLDAVAWLQHVPQARLLAPVDQLAPCLDARRTQPLGHRHGRSWVLADASALTGRCAEARALRNPRRYEPALGRVVD